MKERRAGALEMSPQSTRLDPSRWGGDDPHERPAFPTARERAATRKVDAAAPARVRLDRDGLPLPTLRDAGTRWLLLLTVILQAMSWAALEGYQIADAVEFMERAQAFVRGEEMIDSSIVRPFGMSFLFLPFFALADWFALQDQRVIVWAITLLQLAFGCALVVQCARVAAQIAGRNGAWVAGFIVAINPVFLQYTAQPISDIVAGVFVGLALERVLVRADKRSSLVAGLWFGAAFVVAYKTLVLSLIVSLVLFARDRFRRDAAWPWILCGLSIVVFVQSLFDLAMYGVFGASLFNYLAQNVMQVITSIVLKTHTFLQQSLGFGGLLRVAEKTYRAGARFQEMQWDGPTDTTVRGLQHPLFYLVELPHMLAWPIIGLLVAGIARCVRSLRWPTTILALLFVVTVVVLSNKGSKEFRLWLPMLAAIAALCAHGFDWIARIPAFRRSRALRASTLALAAVASLALGERALAQLNTRKFGVYWRAMDLVNERVAARWPQTAGTFGPDADRPPELVRVGSAYHWAVYERWSPQCRMVKLPWQLNQWSKYAEEPDGGRAKHDETREALADLDVLIIHLPVLSNHPALAEWIALHFKTVGALFDHASNDGLGPVLVLERWDGDPSAARLIQITRDVDAETFCAEKQLTAPCDFISSDGGERLRLLGVEYRTLPPQDFGWITYHWTSTTPFSRDWTLLDRLTAKDERNVWANNHTPAWGTLPTSKWTSGEIVSEGYLVVPADEPYRSGAPWRPIGGAYRRGDLIPVRSWMRVVGYAPNSSPPLIEAELQAAAPSSSTPLLRPPIDHAGTTSEGRQWSADGFVRVGAFFMPVADGVALPDDGRPVPK